MTEKRAIVAGCGCGKKTGQPSLGWTVDIGSTDKKFSDGSTKKTFSLISEANLAVARLGLTGTIRPRPAVSGEKP